MRQLRTFTKHYELESRQYELFGVDLGEGVRRRALLVGVAVVVGWVAVLHLVGVSLRPSTFLGWVAPPILLTYYGTSADASGRRMRLVEWCEAARFLLAGRRPLTGLRPDVPGERPLAVRMSARVDGHAGLRQKRLR